MFVRACESSTYSFSPTFAMAKKTQAKISSWFPRKLENKTKMEKKKRKMVERDGTFNADQQVEKKKKMRVVSDANLPDMGAGIEMEANVEE